MKAKKLIDVAEAKGYTIGRESKNKYYYSWVGKMGRSHEREFFGTFQEFVKFVEGL